MVRKSLLLGAALSLAVVTPVLAQGGGGGGGGGAGGGAAASSGAGTGTSSSNGASGPSAPSGTGTNATTTGVHTNNSPTNPNVQPATPNGTAPASTQNGTDRSGITATNGANSNGNGGQQMSPAEQARTGTKTLPSSETPGAVSAPGVGVGHAANGLPIGTPGSGTSNVDQK